jgi:hypothetical protein
MDTSNFGWNDLVVVHLVGQPTRARIKQYSQVRFLSFNMTIEKKSVIYLPESCQMSDYRGDLKFPTSLDDINSVASLLMVYKEEHFLYVLVLFCSAYIYKQTFAIPGSVFMVSCMIFLEEDVYDCTNTVTFRIFKNSA